MRVRSNTGSEQFADVSLETLRARVNGRHEESVFLISSDHAVLSVRSALEKAETRAIMTGLQARLNPASAPKIS